MTRPSWADAWERASATPPEAPKVAPRPAQARTLGSCKAIDADTGRQCKKLEHADAVHKHERGEFLRVLQPGATPRLREVLDAAATRREAPDFSQVESSPVVGRKRGHGQLKASIARNKAHAGLKTTEAHRPEDSKYFVADQSPH